ncbi:lamin tail domain-containing protein [Nitrosopumilus sp.]|uniref:lamin tail domain-containing protein n=1 Tax=Nitrosopumilus sp. TaxID=2024843 RepID=UPI003D0B59AD
MNQNLPIVLSIILLVGVTIPAYAQTADNVVINEVDINPPGDDSHSVSEWIELYNPTDSEIDLSGWEIAPLYFDFKTPMSISTGTVIEPGQFLTFSYQKVWFNDYNESIELRNENGIVVDKTPLLSDIQNDFTSWQRIYDGYDLDNSDDWKFVTSTSGSTNGKLIETQVAEEITVDVSSTSPSYLFGETAIIQGSVSEEVFIEKPTFKPETIFIHITGPNYDKTFTMYPDFHLNFETSLNLHQVLGINEGKYDVVVSYAGVSANTSFNVGHELILEEEKEESSLSLITDKSQYMPGETVSIIGLATEIIEFQGIKFSVTDSNGDVVYTGNLFPTDGEFNTSIFLSIVNPTYGTYEIVGTYVGKSTTTTFEVVEDVKEDVPISLWTDKDAYGLGDLVTISGRLNDHWIDSLDLEIVQTKSLSLGVKGTSGGGSLFKIQDSIRPDGLGKFEYTFTIPDGESRLGDYRIKISKDIGSVTKSIVAVENPETYVPITEDLIVTTDKSDYDFTFDKQLIISGAIANPVERTSFELTPVKIIISTEDGSPLEIVGLPEGAKRLSTGGISVGYEFTAIPEASGTFRTEISLERLIFSEGAYVVQAEYAGGLKATTPFQIHDDLKDGAGITLDKDVYGFGETVHVSGILPTSDSAVDISLTRPDGTKTTYGESIDNQRFSWSWTTPVSERYQNIKEDDGRDVTKTNIGIYKIKVSTTTFSEDLLFKVSDDPENDSISTTPIFVTTEKSLYKAGDKLKVIGNVIPREQGDEGLVVPDRVTIKVLDGAWPYDQIHESSVYPNQGGDFSSLFELPATIFSNGVYTVKALYSSVQTTSTFGVSNDFTFGIDDPVSLDTSTDKLEYYPGETVIISGKPNKLIYLEAYDVSIIKKSDTEISCGSFVCGIHTGPIVSIQPGPSGSFTHEFAIPDDSSALGTYEVTVDADFEAKHIQFNVVEEPPAPKLERLIEKENRIPDKTISVSTQDKTVDDVILSPRVVSGSLITPIKDEASNVNLKVSSESGVCIIGPDADCLVSESTRKPGQIYDVVEVDGMSLNVRYSGPDVRLEKFSILPESSESFLPDSDWNVEVLKDEQVSRFYYKVTYKTLE